MVEQIHQGFPMFLMLREDNFKFVMANNLPHSQAQIPIYFVKQTELSKSASPEPKVDIRQQ